MPSAREVNFVGRPIDSQDPRVDPAAFRCLSDRFHVILEDAQKRGHHVDKDPMLTLDPEGLVCRYLIAEENNAAKAEARLRATIDWRQRWNILEYHRPGEAQRLFTESSNPGAEMYFADSLHADRHGQPYIVGRACLLNPENIHPWNHLRAAQYVVEQLALKVLQSRCGYASYILDVSDVAQAGTVSGTGGGPGNRHESRNPHFAKGAGADAPKELLQEFGALNTRLAVLRAGIRICTEYYPEFLSHVVFLRPNVLFSAAFRIFRVWFHPRTRKKLRMLGGWANPPVENLEQWYDRKQLPAELGGEGWRLGHDAFLRNALEAYASGAASVTQPVGPPGGDEERAALAEALASAAQRPRGPPAARTPESYCWKGCGAPCPRRFARREPRLQRGILSVERRPLHAAHGSQRSPAPVHVRTSSTGHFHVSLRSSFLVIVALGMLAHCLDREPNANWF